MKKSYKPLHSPIFEELEPRLLFSADVAEVLATEVVEQDFEEEPIVIADLEAEEASDVAVDQPVEKEEAAADAVPAEEATEDDEESAQESSVQLADKTKIDNGIEQEPTIEESIETSLSETSVSKELVLINEDVWDRQQLIDDMQQSDDSDRTIEVIVLDDEIDGIDQVTEILQEYEDLDAVHFISHSSDAFLHLGSSWYDSTNLFEQKEDLSTWNQAMTSDGDLLFYGCNLANSEDGEIIIDTLAEITNLDVTASVDMTGSGAHGGDWELEYYTGTIETSVVVSEVAQADYDSVLTAFIVDNTNDSGAGSLRKAISDANTSANSGGPDTITFNIGADGSQQTINLLSALDPITEAVIIDGFSQYGALTPTIPLIVLNGTGTTDADGIHLALGSDGSTIQGLVINNFDDDGILITDSNNNIIVGNYIGTDANGTADQGNGKWGIEIYESSDNTIGGSTDIDRNVISGNDDDGIMLYGVGTTGTIIQGNYIGTNATGTAAIANTNTGICIESNASNNTIGGTLPAERNIISGNGEDGVFIYDASNNTVSANYIGTDVTGTIALGNIRHGVTLYDGAASNTIGGSVAGAGNIISANGDVGVVIDGNSGSTTDNNIISGNHIGIDKDGTGNLGNTYEGIWIFNGADNNIIGGTNVEERNVISGNGTDGISIQNTDSITISGNYIGTDATGTADLGNTEIGVEISASTGNTISDNVISGNNVDGLALVVGATSNTVTGNKIGTNASGDAFIGNAEDGIWISNSNNNIIGGTDLDDGNLISGNDWAGISFTGSSSNNLIRGNEITENLRDGIWIESTGTGNSILENQIYANTGLGIDLNNDGLTSNDAEDPDTGANNLQNFPILSTATGTDTEITITGTLNSTANSYFRIEFFASTAADGSGYGEGETYLGYAEVATGVSGDATINATLTASVADGAIISATATKCDNDNYNTFTDTSEFAQNIVADINTAPVATADPGDYNTTITSLNPVGYWQLDETVDLVASDSGSALNDGTYNGPTLGVAGAISGSSNTAVDFNRADEDYIEIAHNPAYLLDNGTVQLWFNADDLSATQGLISKDTTGFVDGGHFYIDLSTTGEINVRLQSSAANYTIDTSGVGITAGSWHHVALTFGDLGMQLYLDGEQVGTNAYTGGLGTTSGGTGNAENLVIGANTYDSDTGVVTPLTKFFDGRIDEVALIGSQISALQVKQLFGAGLQHYTVADNTTLNVTITEGVLANDFDTEGDNLTVVLASAPSHAASFTLNADGSFDYTPTTDYIGTDTFTYYANDGISNSNTVIVTLTINDVNTAPVADTDPISYTNSVLDLNPLTYWRLGETSGTTATDLGSAGNDGVYEGTVTLGVSGALTHDTNTAAGFNGSTDYVDVGNFNVAGSGITLTAWVNADNFDATDQRIISKANDTSEAAHTWMLSTVYDSGSGEYRLRFRLSAGGNTDTLFTSSGALTAGSWYHSVATYDAATGLMKLYLDGNEVGSMVHTVGGAVTTNTDDVFIGANPGVSIYRPFDGRIDEVAVFEKALTSSEIMALSLSDQANIYVVNEDTTLTINTANGVLANDSDADNDSLITVLNTGVSNGTLTLNADGSFSYTPDADWSGTDSFTYTAYDGALNSNIATVTITVNSVNDTPIAANDSFSTNEDTAVTTGNVLTNDDLGDEPTSITSFDATSNQGGTVVNNDDSTFTYTPTANFNGTDFFTYTITDNDNETSTATVTITVNAVNDAPILSGSGFYLTTITEDAVVNYGDLVSAIIASAGGDSITDVDSGAVEGIAIFSLSNSNGTWQYDTGSGWTDVDTVTVNSSILLRDTDSLRFVPNADWKGTELMSFAAWDQTSGTAGTKVDTSTFGGITAFSVGTAIPSITVNPAADAPVAVNDRPALNFDGIDDYIQIADDPSLVMADTFTVEVWGNPDDVTAPEHMILNKEGEYEIAIRNGTIQWGITNTDPGWSWHDTGYTVSANQWTHIAFSYDNGVANVYVNGALIDTYSGSGTIGDNYPAMNELRIGGRSNNPSGHYFDGQIADVRIWNTVRTQTEINDNQNVTLTGTETGLVGYWLLNDGSSTTAVDSSLEGNDGLLGGGVVAQEPTWSDFTVDEDGTLNVSAPGILINDFDADGDTLIVNTTPITNVSHGSLTLSSDGSFVYKPDADFNGVDSFTYQISDGNGETDTADVTITVNAVNDASVITGDITGSTTEGNVISGDLNATDVEGLTDTTYFTVTGAATNGTAAIDAETGAWTFTPTDSDWFGTDQFTVTVTDDLGGITTQQISITLTNTDDASVITGDITGSGTEGNVVSGDLNATDIEGLTDTTYFTVTTPAANGTAAIDASTGTWTFTPSDTDWFGTDQFTVTVTDDLGGITTQQVNVTLTNTDDPSVITGDITGSATEGNVVFGDLTATDVEGLTDTTYFTVTGAATNGTAAIDAETGIWTFTPSDTDWFGTDQFTVTVTDDLGGTTTQQISITLTNTDDASVITGDITGSGTEGNVVSGDLNATDVEGLTDTTYFTVTGAATNGTATIDAETGAWTFTPTDTDWFGTDQFTVTVTDDLGGTTTQQISITLTNTDDASVITGDITGSGTEGNVVSGDLDATDIEGLTDTTYFTVTTPAANGTATIDASTGTWTFTPSDTDWFGTDQFTVTVTDDLGGTTTQLLNMTVTISNENIKSTSDVADDTTEPTDESETDSTVDDVFENTDNTYENENENNDDDIVIVESPTDDEIVDLGSDEEDSNDIDEISVADFEEDQPVEEDLIDDEIQVEEEEAILVVDPDDTTETVDILTNTVDQVSDYPTVLEEEFSQTNESTNDVKQTQKENYARMLLKAVKIATTESLEFITPSVSAAPLYFNSPDPGGFEMINEAMRTELSYMNQEMDQAFENSTEEHKVKVYMASGMSASFAVGTASYLLRGGSLLSSFLTTVPLWKAFDPVAILMVTKPKEEKNKKSKSVEENVKQPVLPTGQKAENMFTENENP